MAMHKNQQKVLVFEDRNGVELPMTDENDPKNSSGAAGVDIGNIANHPYLENNPYWELVNNYEDDDADNTTDNTNIEIVAVPAEISETIIDVYKESTGVADG